MENYNRENPTPAEIRKTFLSLPTNAEQTVGENETLEDIEIELRKTLSKTSDPKAKKEIENDLKRVAILIKQQQVVDLEMKKATSTKYTFGRDDEEVGIDEKALKEAKTELEAQSIINDAKKKKKKKKEQYQELPNEFDELMVDAKGTVEKSNDREKGGHERQERTR
jgi:phosphate-selective porin